MADPPPDAPRPSPASPLAAVATGLVLLSGGATATGACAGSPEASPPPVEVGYIGTTHHVVRSIRYRRPLSPPSRLALGGGLEPLAVAGNASRFLLARADGSLHRLTWRGDSLEVELLRPAVPINAADFDAAADPSVERRWFRVTDLLVTRRGDSAAVFVSYHHWNERAACSVLRLSRLRTSAADLVSGTDLGGAWEAVYETRPCLPVLEGTPDPFTGQRAGGRLAAMEGGRVLMTVGDHQAPRLRPDRVHAQAPDVDYGKTLLVDPATSRARVYSSGHRNPQGLHVDERRGSVWLTEHGPRGGDELNRVVPDGNYGWPYRTHGADYGDLSWPLSGERAVPDATGPVFAWLPSIGVSSLLVVRDSAFARWSGDLLIGALRDESLWRTRIEGDRVVFSERIPVGARVRDLTEGPDGALVVWTDAGDLLRLEPAGDREEGVVLFRRRCTPCHLVGANDRAILGPTLEGVIGREVASVEGFDYSAALERLGGRWTEPRLDTFLAEPASFAPGTRMDVAGIEDPETRAKIIGYLGSLD